MSGWRSEGPGFKSQLDPGYIYGFLSPKYCSSSEPAKDSLPIIHTVALFDYTEVALTAHSEMQLTKFSVMIIVLVSGPLY